MSTQPNDFQFTQTNQNIRFRTIFRRYASGGDDPQIDIVDVSNYAGIPGWTVGNVDVIFKIVDPNGDLVYANAGFETNDFSSPDIDRALTDTKEEIVLLTLDDAGNPVPGRYIIYGKFKDSAIATMYQATLNYNFSYTRPAISIELTRDLIKQQLTSTDTTNYNLYNSSNETITPTKTHAHLIVQPEGGGMSPVPGSANLLSRTIGGGATAELQLWTGVYQVYITTTAYWEVELLNSVVLVAISDVLEGYDHIDITIDEITNLYYACLKQLQSRYEASVGYYNPNVNSAIRNKINELSFYWMIKLWSDMIGQDSSDVNAMIKQILVSTVGCTASVDTIPQPLPPNSYYGQPSGGGTGAAILFGEDTPAPEVGVNGDIYIQTAGAGEGDVYQKNTTWQLKLNIMGSTPEAPAAFTRIYSDFTTTQNSGVIGWHTLKTVDFADPLSVGEGLNIRACVFMSAMETSVVAAVYLNGDALISVSLAELSDDTLFIFDIRLTKTDDDKTYYESICTTYGTVPGKVYVGGSQEIAHDWALNGCVIVVKSYKGAAGEKDQECRYLMAEVSKIES